MIALFFAINLHLGLKYEINNLYYNTEQTHLLFYALNCALTFMDIIMDALLKKLPVLTCIPTPKFNEHLKGDALIKAYVERLNYHITLSKQLLRSLKSLNNAMVYFESKNSDYSNLYNTKLDFMRAYSSLINFQYDISNETIWRLNSLSPNHTLQFKNSSGDWIFSELNKLIEIEYYDHNNNIEFTPPLKSPQLRAFFLFYSGKVNSWLQHSPHSFRKSSRYVFSLPCFFMYERTSSTD